MQYAPATTAQYIEEALKAMNRYKELNGMIERCHQNLRVRFDSYLYQNWGG
jgi:hypothetical protein